VPTECGTALTCPLAGYNIPLWAMETGSMKIRAGL
jgi:hypothetical protein